MKLATLCYLKDTDAKKTLMLYRNKKENDMHEGKYNGLGGKLEPSESPEECARREIFEESGLTVKNLILKGFITFPAFDGFEDWYVWVYVSTQFSGELVDSAEGTLEWIDDAEISKLPMWDGDKVFIPWIEGDKIFSAKFNYAAGKMIDYVVSFY